MLRNEWATARRASGSRAWVRNGSVSGYSVLISTWPCVVGRVLGDVVRRQPVERGDRARVVVRRPSRMPRENACAELALAPVQLAQPLAGLARRGRRPTAGSHAGRRSSTRCAPGVEDVGVERGQLRVDVRRRGGGRCGTAGPRSRAPPPPRSPRRRGARRSSARRARRRCASAIGDVVPQLQHRGVAGGCLLEGGDVGPRVGQTGAWPGRGPSPASRPRRRAGRAAPAPSAPCSRG